MATRTPTFKLTEEQWTDSLALATQSTKLREEWWAALGATLGFDPTTVEFVRPLVFSAAPAEKTESAMPEIAPPEEQEAPQTRVRPKIDVDLTPFEEPREKASPVVEHYPATVVETEGRRLVRLDQVGCARCGADAHHGITYRRLHQAVQLGDVTLTHWAWCPRSGEPILLTIRDVDGDVRVPADLARLIEEQGIDVRDDD